MKKKYLTPKCKHQHVDGLQLMDNLVISGGTTVEGGDGGWAKEQVDEPDDYPSNHSVWED